MLKHFSLRKCNSSSLKYGLLITILNPTPESDGTEVPKDTRSVISRSNTSAYFPISRNEEQQHSFFSHCNLTINGDIYNIFQYTPQITYITCNPCSFNHNLDQSQSRTSDVVGINNGEIKSSTSNTTKKDPNDHSSVGWTESDTSLEKLIGTKSYETVILEVNKLDNKKFQNSDEVLLEKMKNTMCSSNIDESKRFRVNNKTIKTEVAETMLKALTHVYTPGL